MGVISYFGTFGAPTGGPGGIIGGVGMFKTVLVGGKNELGLYGGLLVTAAWSLIIYYTAISRRLPTSQVDHNVRDVYPPPVAE